MRLGFFLVNDGSYMRIPVIYLVFMMLGGFTSHENQEEKFVSNLHFLHNLNGALFVWSNHLMTVYMNFRDKYIACNSFTVA